MAHPNTVELLDLFEDKEIDHLRIIYTLVLTGTAIYRSFSQEGIHLRDILQRILLVTHDINIRTPLHLPRAQTLQFSSFTKIYNVLANTRNMP